MFNLCIIYFSGRISAHNDVTWVFFFRIRLEKGFVILRKILAVCSDFMSCWNSTLFHIRQLKKYLTSINQKTSTKKLRILFFYVNFYENSPLFSSYREVHKMEQATPLLQSTMELLKNAIHTQQQLKQEQSKRFVKKNYTFYNYFWRKIIIIITKASNH